MIKKDFPDLKVLNNDEINDYLLNNAAYIAEGQVDRLNGIKADLINDLDIDDIESYINFNKQKIGIRLKGAGRASQIFLDNNYTCENELFDSNIIDIKGIGTQKLSENNIEYKKNGFLSNIDAFTEFA